MFSWGRRKADRAKEVEAYNKGAELGGDIAQAMLTYKEERFGPVHGRYMDVLKDKLREAISDGSAPPINLASIHYNIFKENVEKLPADMFAEMQVALKPMLEIADIVGVREDVDTSMWTLCRDFAADLLADGQDTVKKYIEVLADADDAWRKHNPIEALKWPVKESY